MIHISPYDIEYTITMYLHYKQEIMSGMLTEKRVNKLLGDYRGWIADPKNRCDEDCLYDRIRNKDFKIISISYDENKPFEFVVFYSTNKFDLPKYICLKYKGIKDHSGVFDVVKG